MTDYAKMVTLFHTIPHSFTLFHTASPLFPVCSVVSGWLPTTESHSSSTPEPTAGPIHCPAGPTASGQSLYSLLRNTGLRYSSCRVVSMRLLGRHTWNSGVFTLCCGVFTLCCGVSDRLLMVSYYKEMEIVRSAVQVRTLHIHSVGTGIHYTEFHSVVHVHSVDSVHRKHHLLKV